MCVFGDEWLYFFFEEGNVMCGDVYDVGVGGVEDVFVLFG